jgi:UDP-GlcNAc:undecaprenyl-phosphate GlcNAc-1-phosphate transferase
VHRLRPLGLTMQGSVVLLGTGSFSSVLVGVLVHTGWTGEGAVVWVGAGVLLVVAVLLRIPVQQPRRMPSTQVSGHLRVRNG